MPAFLQSDTRNFVEYNGCNSELRILFYFASSSFDQYSFEAIFFIRTLLKSIIVNFLHSYKLNIPHFYHLSIFID